MIRVRQVKIDINKNTNNDIKLEVSKILNIKINDIKNIKINKQSIDARKKPTIYFIYEVDCEIYNEENILKYNKNINVLKTPIEEYKYDVTGTKELKYRPIIVGSGPSGLFCAYNLARNGYKPIIIERGEKVEDRAKTIEEFWNNNILNENSNVQFGEGGAGTFSDGKLNTMVKDPDYRCKEVFKTFVECGANPNIMYLAKPHIGTDLLRKVIINLRNKIIELGGEFRYNTCLTNIIISNNKIEKIEVNNNELIDTSILVLAIGHSARDTFYMLKDKLSMEAKPFAVGIRIQHNQKMINKSQYGMETSNILGPSDYKLTYQASNNRGVYTFCMCPGGYVVNASSEKDKLCINGMSYSLRDSENANSAVIVTITPKDFGSNPMDGIEFQRKLESKAYSLGKGHIPTQLYKDYKEHKISTAYRSIKPIFKGNMTFADLNLLFPDYINISLKEAIEYFGTRIKDFNNDDSILAGVEARTSSPIRILRNDILESNIEGIYPCGEGAGYAGGITSASMDGLKVSESIMKTYKTCNK